MKPSRIILAVALATWTVFPASGQNNITRYVRYSHNGTVSYGVLEGELIQPLRGDLFGSPKAEGAKLRRDAVKLLAPVNPSKVIAVGLNYKSHLGSRPVPPYPGLFAKFPTCIIGPDEAIVFPPEAGNVHYEGELVLVIGKKTKDVSISQAADSIFGVTAGNDVSERNWQQSDLQWFRAKASDTFGPVGPAIVRGLNYSNLLLQTRLNGAVEQSQRTSDLLFDPHKIVSYVSRFVTLMPGDIIFTGTPGATKAMKAGDVVEVEIEGVGILRNRVAGP